MSAGSQSPLALSLPLLRWLRDDPIWSGLPLPQRMRLVWQARWGSINSRLGRALAGQGEPVVLEDPLLIVGPWRSGTTVMHELLAAALGRATPLTWQCMNACAFELTPRRSGGRSIARPMDGLEISDESPQEDEFALLALGVDSAYRAFWMPHRIGELHHTLDPQYWLANPAWLTVWEAFLRGVLRTASQPRQPLILKSPNHTYRLRSILRRFPRTRVVWMARPARQVFLSNRKMWQAMFEAHGMGAPCKPDQLDAFLARALHQAAEELRWCASTLAAGRWALVHQAHLLADPLAAVRDVRKQLQYEFTLAEDALTRAIERTRSGRVDRYAALAELGPDIELACRALDDAQACAGRLNGLVDSSTQYLPL